MVKMDLLNINRAIILNLVIKSYTRKITVFQIIYSSIYNYDPNIEVTCISNAGPFSQNLVPHTEILQYLYMYYLDLHSATKHLPSGLEILSVINLWHSS